jgi:hypothetical protein
MPGASRADASRSCSVAHVAIWTALPALLSHNLQLDLAEDLALGARMAARLLEGIRRCRGGSPISPIGWWGDVRAVYLLGPLSAAACMYVVWLLGREIVGGFQALIAVAGAGGAALLQFLGAEIRARPDCSCRSGR